MKTYVKETMSKLNEMLAKYPDAHIRFNSISNALRCGCKFLSCDINYCDEDNTIYIGG